MLLAIKGEMTEYKRLEKAKFGNEAPTSTLPHLRLSGFLQADTAAFSMLKEEGSDHTLQPQRPHHLATDESLKVACRSKVRKQT
jgi:hypothetical protein